MTQQASTEDQILDSTEDLLAPAEDTSDEKVVPDQALPVEEEVEEEVEDDEDVEEPEESEDELEEEEEEISFYDIPRRQEILKTHPDIFKKYPGLEHAIYRNKAYSDIFPTLQDAKEAKSAQENYQRLSESITSGSLETLLTEIKQADGDTFKSVVSPRNILGTLQKLDQASYYDMLGHVISNTLHEAFLVGKEKGDTDEGKNLRAAAQILNNYIFRTPHTSPVGGNPQGKQDDPKQKELEERERDFNMREFSTAAQDVHARSESVIRKTIEKRIDQNGQMTEYVKSRAIEDVIKLVEKELESDNRYQQIINRLWKESKDNKYSDATRKRIVGAVLAKAKTILDDSITKVRRDVLKGAAARERRASVDNRPVIRGTPASQNKSSNSAPRSSQDQHREALKDFKGSTLDWLDQRLGK